MILVTGAAGKTGQAVLRTLKALGPTTRALVRRAEYRPAVLVAGASEVVLGDLRDPEAVRQALQGIRAIYHICPNVSPDEVEIGEIVLRAAVREGVEHFVFHSVLHPQTEAMPHHWRKLRVEERIFESGLPFTILQPAAYFQNLLAQRQSVIQEGVFAVPYDLPTCVSMVDLEDVAQVASRVLTEDGHRGATYELCSPQLLDQEEAAGILAAATGREVVAKSIPREVWRREAQGSGLDEERLETLLAMFQYYERHGLVGNGNALRWLLGREPTDLMSWARRSFNPA